MGEGLCTWSLDNQRPLGVVDFSAFCNWLLRGDPCVLSKRWFSPMGHKPQEIIRKHRSLHVKIHNSSKLTAER